MPPERNPRFCTEQQRAMSLGPILADEILRSIKGGQVDSFLDFIA
jgi:hypothetical protein